MTKCVVFAAAARDTSDRRVPILLTRSGTWAWHCSYLTSPHVTVSAFSAWLWPCVCVCGVGVAV
jgi:hypothetical protein